ncbi:MAG TPA: flagellar basal body-associated FliL family protein [Labilithrix sp.]|nr:flagellar basal body-associated FliL family protein [Labilithrix sp.]
MSTPADPKPADKPADTAAAPAAAAPAKSSAIGGIMKLLVPALLAAGASYGGARAAAAHGPQAPAAAESHHAEAPAPGPTVPLEPFLITIADARGKGHVMKVSVAVEFDHLAKEEGLKPFAPRIRDAILSYLRALSYEDAGDGTRMEKLRSDMLERCRSAGATSAVRVLVTDFVLQ